MKILIAVLTCITVLFSLRQGRISMSSSQKDYVAWISLLLIAFTVSMIFIFIREITFEVSIVLMILSVSMLLILKKGININKIYKYHAFKSSTLPVNIAKKTLPYLFFLSKNKEEIIGDLLEQDEYMKALEHSDSKRIRNILIQIFLISLLLIKTKIENLFSTVRKIGFSIILVGTVASGIISLYNYSSNRLEMFDNDTLDIPIALIHPFESV